MWSCVSDAKDWSLVNKLELSEDKAKALLLVPSQSANLPASLQIGQTCVHFADSARNISVSFDSSLSMRDYISKVRKIAYLEMRRIRFIRKYFTTEATKTQVSSLVISCLEYYNYLLADIPQKRIATLQITGFLCLTESNKKKCNCLLQCYLRLCASISYRSSSAIHSLPVSPLICWFTNLSHSDQTQQIQRAARFFLYWPCHLE